MRSNNRSYFISAARKELTPKQNLERHTELYVKLNKLGLDSVEGTGLYQGIPELMFVVNSDNTIEESIVNLAKEFKQECIMIVYAIDSVAELVYPYNCDEDFVDRKVIGKMVCLGENEGALRGRDYSYIDNKFYVVE